MKCRDPKCEGDWYVVSEYTSNCVEWYVINCTKCTANQVIKKDEFK